MICVYALCQQYSCALININSHVGILTYTDQYNRPYCDACVTIAYQHMKILHILTVIFNIILDIYYQHHA